VTLTSVSPAVAVVGVAALPPVLHPLPLMAMTTAQMQANIAWSFGFISMSFV
jgi:hypothetical protein